MKNEISWQPRADGLIKLEDIDFIWSRPKKHTVFNINFIFKSRII
jgi:hypothetical protein